MARPRVFDLDELLAIAETGDWRTVPELMEQAGIPREHLRTVQKTVNKYFGPRPPRPKAVAGDRLRRRVVAWMVANGLDEHYCFQCQKWSAFPCSIRELRQDDELGSLAFVCRHCTRAGDL